LKTKATSSRYFQSFIKIQLFFYLFPQILWS
jgi:hypothetical protein